MKVHGTMWTFNNKRLFTTKLNAPKVKRYLFLYVIGPESSSCARSHPQMNEPEISLDLAQKTKQTNIVV